MIRPCPRCAATFEDAYAAMTRATPQRDIEICSSCGMDEAVGRGLVAVANWPLVPAA